MKYCEHCEKENPDEAVYCVKCGKLIGKDLMNCPVCHQVIKQSDISCSNCSSYLHGDHINCHKCGTELSKDYKFCPTCHAPRKEYRYRYLGLGIFSTILYILLDGYHSLKFMENTPESIYQWFFYSSIVLSVILGFYFLIKLGVLIMFKKHPVKVFPKGRYLFGLTLLTLLITARLIGSIPYTLFSTNDLITIEGILFLAYQVGLSYLGMVFFIAANKESKRFIKKKI